MKTVSELRGLGVAMCTPFTPGGAVDYEATTRLVEYLVGNGVDFLVVLGTTGEAPTLSPEEQSQLVGHVVRVNAGRLPVVVGRSSNNTSSLVRELEAMDCSGVDFILSAVPSYNKPSQQGIFEHFQAVAQSSPRPVILYNVPGRTGMNMATATTLRIAREVSNIVGIKEASGNLDQAAEIIRHRPEGFVVLSGDDALTLPMIALGGDGVISVIGNALPARFGALVHSVLEGDLPAARAQHLSLLELYRLLFAENNPAGIKAALSHLQICANVLRLPLVPVREELQRRISAELEALC